MTQYIVVQFLINLSFSIWQANYIFEATVPLNTEFIMQEYYNISGKYKMFFFF